VDPGYLAVAAICLLAIWPFLSNPSLPEATDTELHIFRLAEMSRLVRGGELLPRWAPNFYFGYGYPIFNFYAPLTYQLGLVFDFMPLLGPVQAVKILFIIGIGLSGLGMYGLVRDIWGRGAGLVASASYVYAPFILFVDPYARGDLPESFSFGVFAVALWAINRLRQSPSWKNWLAAVFFIAALIMTHNLMSMVFFTILFLWSIWQLVIKENGQVEPSITGGIRRVLNLRVYLALLFAVALAASFWLPVALESDTVNLGTLVGEGGHFDYRNNFLELSELFGGIKRLDWGATEPDYSLNMGIAQIILGLIGVCALLVKRTRARKQGTFFLIALIVLIVLMLVQSTPLWEFVPMLPFLQFPWRLLGAAAAMLAVLGGIGASMLLKFAPERFAGWIVGGIVGLVLLSAMPLVHVPPWTDDFGETTAQRVLEYEIAGKWLGTTSTADFVPVTVDSLPKPEPALVDAIRTQQPIDRVNRITLPENTVVVSESVTPLWTRYHVSGDQDFLLRLFQFDFPGWEAKIDGDRVETELGRPEGFLVVPVPAGEHTVEIRFTNTWERKVALFISAVGLLGALIVAWQFGKHRGKMLVQFQDEAGEAAEHEASTWPALGISMILLAVFVLFIEPSAVMRYDSKEFNAQPAETDVYADFGEQIALIGYDFNPEVTYRGDQVDITLYWKALNSIDINYQVFVHLLDEEGQIIAQSDKLNPGDFPTRRWPLDKYVRDEHSFVIPDWTPDGEYAISVGLWAAAEGWRLPLLDVTGEQVNDNYMLSDRVVLRQD
jgi:hypothetical protein